jgi:hypothetical protein
MAFPLPSLIGLIKWSMPVLQLVKIFDQTDIKQHDSAGDEELSFA